MPGRKANDADGKVTMLADGNGDFAKAAGLTMDGSKFGMGERSQRYSMLVNDGVVERAERRGAGRIQGEFGRAYARAALDSIAHPKQKWPGHGNARSDPRVLVAVIVIIIGDLKWLPPTSRPPTTLTDPPTAQSIGASEQLARCEQAARATRTKEATALLERAQKEARGAVARAVAQRTTRRSPPRYRRRRGGDDRRRRPCREAS